MAAAKLGCSFFFDHPVVQIVVAIRIREVFNRFLRQNKADIDSEGKTRLTSTAADIDSEDLCRQL